MDLLTPVVNVAAERAKLRILRNEINADAQARLAYQRHYTARGYRRAQLPNVPANHAMPRLHSDARGPELAQALPDMPVVWCAGLASNPRPQGPSTLKGAFNPGYGRAQGVGGLGARRAAAAEAMRRWMFDPAPEHVGPRQTEANEETQVSETA